MLEGWNATWLGMLEGWNATWLGMLDTTPSLETFKPQEYIVS
jgi:hypothetical protein